MKTKFTKDSNRQITAAASVLVILTWLSSLHAQDLPFTSTSTGADGALSYKATTTGGRTFPGMAYDAVRQQMVLFGGWNGSVLLSGTWLLDTNYNWMLATSATSPPLRDTLAMAYDEARQQVVMFGGNSAGSLRSDTWVWDGTNWFAKTPNTNPGARWLHTMVYDSIRQEIVLFGGSRSSSGGTPVNDTWVWDSTNWTLRTPSNSPSARTTMGMAFDRARGTVVLFGGNTGTSSLDDTWLWDGTNWSLASPASKPTLRGSPAMAYDEDRREVVLFGDVDDLTWTWNGTNWLTKTPGTHPSARWGHVMAFDRVRSRIVLYGGWIGYRANDTWSWDGTNWTFISDSTRDFDMRSKADGVWNFTGVEVGSNVTVNFIKNAANTPVTWLATSNVIINGTLNLNGQSGLSGGGSNQLPGNEAQGGPGGFAGGLGGIRFDQSGSYAGTPGQGPGGGLPGVTQIQWGSRGTHVSTYGNAYIQPLIGGSGGGGGGASASGNGHSGGGGGGAIYISSSRDITINGLIAANGGGGAYTCFGCGNAGGGSGGAIRLQADRISGTGTLQVYGGSGYNSSVYGEGGRIRIEAYYRTLASSGSFSVTPVVSAPVTNQNFAVSGSILIASVAGQNVVQPPGGSTQSPDVMFTSAGPINVTATSTNIPNGSPVVLRVTSNGQVIQATNNLAGGTATFNVTVPAGVGTIQASATFTIGN